MTTLFNGAILHVTGTDGNPLAYGWVTTYAAGTTTPKTCYSDQAKTTPKANPFQLDAYGEAPCWLDGTYKILVQTSTLVTLPNYPVDYVPGNNVAVNDLSASTGATMVGYGATTVAAALDSLSVAGRKVSVRQCAITGPHGTNGESDLGGATGSATVTTTNITSGVNTLYVTAAKGFSSSGALDYVGFTTSNIAFGSLTTNGVMYLYVDVAATTGLLTPGAGTLAPTYSDAAPSVVAGQFSYVISEGVGYVGNGATAVASARVYIGEVDVAGNVVTAIRWYAYQGRYDSGYTASIPAVGTMTTKNSNLGIKDGVSVSLILECTTIDFNWAVGDVISNPLAGGGTTTLPTLGINTNVITFTTGSTQALFYPNKTTGAQAQLTLASWKYKVTAKRDW